MSPSGYIVEVTCLSPNATEKDVYDFFAFCGAIEHVGIERAGESANTAYVTFRNPHALETAVLLSGATIVDRPVCITRWQNYEYDYYQWNQNHTSCRVEDYSCHSQQYAQEYKFVPSAGETVLLAQDVVKTMVAKGYVLGKDALIRARAFDQSHQITATAVAQVSELSDRIGLTHKICAGVEAARSMDQRYHIYDTTKYAVSATGRTAVSAATAVVNSSYFSKGALWVSDVLSRAALAAADLGNRGAHK